MSKTDANDNLSHDSAPDTRGMQRRKFLTGMAVGVGLAPMAALTGLFRARPEAAAPAFAVGDLCMGKAVLRPSDFTYLGLFKMPSVTNNPTRRSWGYLTGRRVGSELRLILSGPGQEIAGYGGIAVVNELMIPTALTKDINTAPRATLVQTWTDIFGGKGAGTGMVTPSGIRLRGLHWDEARHVLWYGYSTYYDGNPWNPALAAATLGTNGASTAYGGWRTTVHSTAACGGGTLMEIPAWFRPYVNGAPFGIGNPPHASNARASFGANLHVWTPPDLATPPDPVTNEAVRSIQATTLLFHPMQNPQARGTNYKTCGWNVKYDNTTGFVRPGAPWFGGSASSTLLDWMDCAAWIDLPNKHGILFLGQLVDTLAGRTYAGDADNQTHVWYGPQTCTHGQTSPTWGATGPGATTLANQAWIYDPMDLVAVAGGTTPSYGIVPRMDFRAMQLGGFCQEQCTRNYQFGQMFWDPPTQRLYVSEVSAYREADPYPVVHVFQVA